MICNSCGGVINRDCWNPQECAEITAQMRNDEAKMYGQELIDGIRLEVSALQSENTAMRETIKRLAEIVGDEGLRRMLIGLIHRMERIEKEVYDVIHRRLVELEK